MTIFSPRRKWTTLFIAYLGFLVLATHSIHQVGDVTWYKRASYALLRGEQIYLLHPRGVVYPPLYYAILSSIAIVTEAFQYSPIDSIALGPVQIRRSFDLFLLVYSIISISALGTVAYLWHLRLDSPDLEKIWLSFLLFSPWVLYAIPLLGQATWLVLVSLVLAVIAYVENYDRVSGFGFALAACIKIFPGFALVPLILKRPDRRNDLIAGAAIPFAVTGILFLQQLPNSLSAFLDPEHKFGIASGGMVVTWVVNQVTGIDLTQLPLTAIAAVVGVSLAIVVDFDTDIEMAMIPVIFVLASVDPIVNYRWVSIAAVALVICSLTSGHRGDWYWYALYLVAMGSVWATAKIGFEYLTARKYGLVGGFPALTPPFSPDIFWIDILSGQIPMATGLLNTLLIVALVYRLARNGPDSPFEIRYTPVVAAAFVLFVAGVHLLVS